LGFPTGWSFTTHKESSGAIDKDLKNKKPTSTTRQQDAPKADTSKDDQAIYQTKVDDASFV
jgi:hypothetical protein